MPELPEVETVCRGLARRLEGQVLTRAEARRKALRFPLPRNFAARLEGRRVLAVRRRAKYIIADLDDGQSLLGHLGMSGRMLLSKGRPAVLDAHDHVILETADGWCLRFNDARRFGLLDLAPTKALAAHRLLADLGPEPLGRGFNGRYLAAALAGRKTSIKAALLDQRLIAGIGNIYASEALYHARIAPDRLAATLTPREAVALAQAIKNVLRAAIKAGGSSLRDYVQTDGELGYFQHRWAVYGKEGAPCPGCTCRTGGKTGGIKRITQAGRSTFYCPHKQK